MKKRVSGLKRAAKLTSFTIVAVLLAMLAQTALAAQSQALSGYGDASEIEGVVRYVFKDMDGERLVLVLEEWPVAIMLDGSTAFETESHLKVSLATAKGILPGQAVRVDRRLNADGETEARLVTVLKAEDLLRLRHLQKERMKKHILLHKDAKTR